MGNLTEDLIIEILISLPLFSIVRCRCVCKSWYKLLDQKFVSMKLNYDVKHENFILLVTKRKTVDYYNFRYNVESKSLRSSEDVVKIMYPFEEYHSDYRFVDVLRGFLCLLSSVSDPKFEIWEMKDYGVRESWSKVFKIDHQQLMLEDTIRFCKYIRRAVSLKDGEILLEMITENRRCIWFPERAHVAKIHLDETKRRQTKRGYGYDEYMKSTQEMEAYVESLISVNSGTFVGNQQQQCEIEKNPQLSAFSDLRINYWGKNDFSDLRIK